jgi:hypothetical protein
MVPCWSLLALKLVGVGISRDSANGSRAFYIVKEMIPRISGALSSAISPIFSRYSNSRLCTGARAPHEQAPSFGGRSSPACRSAAYSCLRFGSAASRRPAPQTAILRPTTLGQCVPPKQGAMDLPVAATAKRTAS